MKLKTTSLIPLIFALLLPLHAEETVAKDSTTDAEEELPEYSDPPYTVGDRAFIQGYYIPAQDGISLNFRIRNNQMFVYWVDEDDLIVEPLASEGNVRFLSAARALPQYMNELKALGNEAGLGSVNNNIFEPHLFNVFLSLKKAGSDEFDTYTFRYVSEMSAKRETREFDFGKDALLENKEANKRGY